MWIVAVTFPQGDEDPGEVEHYGPFADADEADDWAKLIQELIKCKELQWSFLITKISSPFALASSLLAKFPQPVKPESLDAAQHFEQEDR